MRANLLHKMFAICSLIGLNLNGIDNTKNGTRIA